MCESSLINHFGDVSGGSGSAGAEELNQQKERPIRNGDPSSTAISGRKNLLNQWKSQVFWMKNGAAAIWSYSAVGGSRRVHASMAFDDRAHTP